MPSGQSSTAANRLPVYVDDDTRLGALSHKSNVYAPGGVATTLTAALSGSTVLWDAAAGFTITLPAPERGLIFRVKCSVTATSSAHKIITNAASVFLLGEIFSFTTATASGAGFALNGTTHVAVTMNGTTTGGIIGTDLQFECISATQWLVTGVVVGSGTIATPAATS